MEKKYPVLKCNKELWNEIKPVLKSFGINEFHIDENTLSSDNSHIVSNFGSPMYDNLIIGNTIYYPKEIITEYSRYFVNTKEEFLSAVAKLLGKEYPIKEQSSKTKYPCIKCTQQLYDRIKDISQAVGYEERNMDEVAFDFVHNPYLVVDYLDIFGVISNIKDITKPTDSRYLCSNIREFLTKVCELKGFEVSYIDFVGDGDAENHYFRYIFDKDNNIITIHEIKEDKGECSAIVTNKKQFKKKKERYTVSCDPAIGKDSTVVTVMPTKGNDFDKDKGSDLDIDKNMEKINIANKLKHCKKGTKLYSPLFGYVEFECLDNETICVTNINADGERHQALFNEFGEFAYNYPNAECLLFPSKDNRDWNNFQVLEEGHRVMVSDNGLHWSLRKYNEDNDAYRFGYDKNDCNSWTYIVPVEDFDFTAEDITINKDKSIV